MWMASMALLPVGLFLTYKAMHDSELMNKEFYYRTFAKVKKWVGEKRDNMKNEKPDESELPPSGDIEKEIEITTDLEEKKA
jgi:lipopolysaccharide export system permease protein